MEIQKINKERNVKYIISKNIDKGEESPYLSITSGHIAFKSFDELKSRLIKMYISLNESEYIQITVIFNSVLCVFKSAHGIEAFFAGVEFSRTLINEELK